MTAPVLLRRAAFGLLTAAMLVVAGFLAAAWLGGWTFHVVQSASMAPAVPRDSLAAVVPADGRRAQVGDVVSFRLTDQPEVTVIHRVVERIEQGASVFYRTKGDANAQPDARLVPAAAVTGRVTIDLRGAGVVARQLRPPWTWLVLVGLPMALLAAGEVPRIRRQSRDRLDTEAERLPGDRAWLAPLSPAGRGVAPPAHPSSATAMRGRAAHQSDEDL